PSPPAVRPIAEAAICAPVWRLWRKSDSDWKDSAAALSCSWWQWRDRAADPLQYVRSARLGAPRRGCIAPQQRSSALRADARRARQLVGRIAAQRDEIRHLFGLDAIALAHLIRPNPRQLAGADGIEDRRARRSELKRVTIAACHQCGAAAALFGACCGGEAIVRS